MVKGRDSERVVRGWSTEMSKGDKLMTSVMAGHAQR